MPRVFLEIPSLRPSSPKPFACRVTAQYAGYGIQANAHAQGILVRKVFVIGAVVRYTKFTFYVILIFCEAARNKVP